MDLSKVPSRLHNHVKRNYLYIILTLFVFHIIDLMLTYVGVFIYGFPEGNYIIKAFFDNGLFMEALIFKFVILFSVLFGILMYYKYAKPIWFVSFMMFFFIFSITKTLFNWIVVIVEYGIWG